MSYTLLFNAADTIAVSSHLNSGETSMTVTNGNFGTPTGTQYYVVDYDIPGTAEIISASVSGTAFTSITRGLTGGASSTTNHSAGAKVACIMVPQHYQALVDGSGWGTSAIKLGESPISGDQNLTGSLADLTGMSVSSTINSSGRSIRLDAMLLIQNNTTAGTFSIAFLEDSSIIRQFTGYLPTSGLSTAFSFWFSKTPSSGSHTYKVQASWGGTGTGIAKANSDLLVTMI